MKARPKLFLDTNVLLDYFLEREPFYFDAQRLFSAAEAGRIDAFISAITVNNISYIARKLKSATTAMIVVRAMLDLFKVVPVDGAVLCAAADFCDGDYEDAIQLQCAVRALCTHLFTRNLTDFRTAALAVVPPSAFEL